MKNKFNNVTRKINMFGLSLKKHSPEILAAVGTVGIVAGTVMACKATTHLDDILEEGKKKVEKCHKYAENPDLLPEGTEYTEQMLKQDLTQTYAKTGIEVAKLYLPAVVVTGTGLAMLLGSNHVLRKRNASLGAALVTTTQLFKVYRGHVVERFGERTDFELYHNIRAEEIDMEVVNEDGSVETVKKTVDVVQSPANKFSEYARCFDETNPYFQKCAEHNLVWLRLREEEANKRLKSKGYLFLNDVYEMLGFNGTKAGQTMGWIYDKDNPIGDNEIDFGIYDVYKQGTMDFVNGYEKAVWLDFNIDGYIYDKIW